MNQIQQKILLRLEELERTKEIKIPIAIESGSRAWGFASPDSDYDCRFIYVHPRDWYLSVMEQKDVLEDPVDAIYDVSGWDLKKVVQHLVKSNAVMLEWLSSDEIYHMNPEVKAELWNLGELFFNPLSVSWHYLSMAKNKLDDLLTQQASKIKTYCYVMRPLACLEYIKTHGTIPHMAYIDNVRQITLPEPIEEIIMNLLAKKKTAMESELIARQEMLIEYFKESCEMYEEWLKTLKVEKKKDYEEANQTFRRIIEMVWSNE